MYVWIDLFEVIYW